MLVAVLLASLLAAQTPATPSPEQAQPPKHARVSSAVMEAQCIRKVQPSYPVSAAQQQLQGAVVLKIVVGADGKVTDATAMSGPEVFRQPAVDAVRKWQYKPYLLNGTPTEVETTARVLFQ